MLTGPGTGVCRYRSLASRGTATLALLAATAAVPAAAALEPGAIGNLAFRGIVDQPVKLIDGRYLGEPCVPGTASRPRVRMISELLRISDLDGDNVEEAAALLVESSGGSVQGDSAQAMVIGPLAMNYRDGDTSRALLLRTTD